MRERTEAGPGARRPITRGSVWREASCRSQAAGQDLPAPLRPPHSPDITGLQPTSVGPLLWGLDGWFPPSGSACPPRGGFPQGDQVLMAGSGPAHRRGHRGAASGASPRATAWRSEERIKHPLGTFSQTAPPSRGNRRPSTPVPPLPPSPTRSAQTPRALLPPPGPRAYSHKGPPGRSPPSFSSCSGRGNRRTQCFPPIANALGRAGQGSQGGRRPHDPAPAVLPRV